MHYPRKLIALFTEAIRLRNRHKKGELSAGRLARACKRFDRRLRDLARPAREVPASPRAHQVPFSYDATQRRKNRLDSWNLRESTASFQGPTPS